ncbi:MAG: DUF4115 domain-containing protein, partial [Candidatus Pacebacteria bacterium]|nr:DUF4115 domain-containing protein [Candidatus Paceibacterota bacterium]
LAKSKQRNRTAKTGRKMPNDQATAHDSLPPNLSVGEALKKSRQAKKIQLRTVADKMRIRLEYLEAIENGHFKKLPGMAYGIGFVRTYAEFLELDPQPYIDQFKAENSTTNPVILKAPPKPKLDIQGINPRFYVIGGGVLALVLLAWFLFSGDPETPPRVTEVPPKIAASVANPQAITTPPVTSLAIVPTDRTKPSATLSAPAPAATPAPAQPAVQAPAAVPATPIKPAAPIYGQGSNPAPLFKPRAATEAAPVAPAPAAAPAAAPARVPPAAPAAAPVALSGQFTLSAANTPVWIEVTNGAGRIIKSKTLMPGESYLVPREPGLRLTTGNAGGIVISQNGKTAPKLGEVGKTRRGIPLDGSLFTVGAQ